MNSIDSILKKLFESHRVDYETYSEEDFDTLLDTVEDTISDFSKDLIFTPYEERDPDNKLKDMKDILSSIEEYANNEQWQRVEDLQKSIEYILRAEYDDYADPYESEKYDAWKEDQMFRDED